MNVGIDTRGVFTKPAAIAAAVLALAASLLLAGWKARNAFEAEAASPAGLQRLESKLDGMDERQRSMAVDVAVIKTKVETLEKRGR